MSDTGGGRPPRTPSGGRLDASMSLIATVVSDALDPAYEEAVRRRDRDGARPASRPRRWGGRAGVVAALALFGLLLGVSWEQMRERAPAAAEQRRELIQRISEGTDHADALQRDVDELRAEVDRLQEDILDTTSSGKEANGRLRALGMSAGDVPVQGPGITVTVSDAQAEDTDLTGDPRDAPPPEAGRVLDQDLQRLVNGLWAAGAEAVAINGQRLTALSAIRSAGEAILVDFRPVAPPYVVHAIGDPKTLEAEFVDGPGGRWFRLLEDNYGVGFDVGHAEELRLPAASSLTLRVARGEIGRQ